MIGHINNRTTPLNRNNYLKNIFMIIIFFKEF